MRIRVRTPSLSFSDQNSDQTVTNWQNHQCDIIRNRVRNRMLLSILILIKERKSNRWFSPRTQSDVTSGIRTKIGRGCPDFWILKTNQLLTRGMSEFRFGFAILSCSEIRVWSVRIWLNQLGSDTWQSGFRPDLAILSCSGFLEFNYFYYS